MFLTFQIYGLWNITVRWILEEQLWHKKTIGPQSQQRIISVCLFWQWLHICTGHRDSSLVCNKDPRSSHHLSSSTAFLWLWADKVTSLLSISIKPWIPENENAISKVKLMSGNSKTHSLPLAYQVRIKSYKRQKLNLSCQISHWHHNTLKAVARGPSSLKAQRDAVYSQLSERGEQV